MKITYIHHSSFAVEALNCSILFDYVKGPLPEFRTNKPIYVLCSHRHSDHFSEKIFRLSDQYDNVYYVLSYDVDNNKQIPERVRKVTTFIHPGQEFRLARFSVRALASTDEGVAFVCDVGGKTVYHAGDLNDWFWVGEDEEENKAMQRAYRSEMAKLDTRLDVAFVPVDPRLEGMYSLGVKELLEHTAVDHLFPMHFWDDYGVCGRLEKELGRPVEQITKKGQVFEIE
jgi:L-ascorbate metabolism protein UlaG (beta-lactamase superfamily)